MYSFKQQLPRLTLAAALALGMGPLTALAQSPAAAVFTFDIASGPLDEVLLDISRQTGVPISFSQDLVQGRRSAAVRGALGAVSRKRPLPSQTALSSARSRLGIAHHRRRPSSWCLKIPKVLCRAVLPIAARSRSSAW